MVPVCGTWTPFSDIDDQIAHYRLWGLIPPKSTNLRPVMVVDGYWGCPEPCTVVGYQGDSWAVVQIGDGLHAIHGDYLAELQPVAYQRLPAGTCFAAILADYIVLDIETTGFSRQNDRIIEIAAIRYRYGKEVSRFDTLINPGMLLPPEITQLTGITQEDIKDAPYLEEISDKFLSYIGSLPIIGHNIVSFDMPLAIACAEALLDDKGFIICICQRHRNQGRSITAPKRVRPQGRTPFWVSGFCGLSFAVLGNN